MIRGTRCWLRLLALAMAWMVGIWTARGVLAAASAEKGDSSEKASDDSSGSETIEIKPYTGPPIFLDEPEEKPAAAIIDRQVDTDKYADGKVRMERQIVKYSDNHFEADGFYREYYPNGQLFAEGKYDKGRQNGQWTYWHDNGQECRKVTYKDGQPDGVWEVHRADGTLAAKRSYKNGKRDGDWVLYDDAGKQPLREEGYKDGSVNDVWKVWFPSGQLKTQIGFKSGQRDGISVEWDEKGVKRGEINYVEGKPHGTATMFGADGHKLTQQYDHGKLVKESKE